VIVSEWVGEEERSYHLAQINSRSGERRYFAQCQVAFLDLQLSPDESWLLLTGSNDVITLMSVADGSRIDFPVPGVISASWWPGSSASTVGLLRNHQDGEAIWSFDLEQNQLTRVSTLEQPFQRVEHGPFFNDLRIHPTEHRALIGAREVGGNQVSLSSLDLTSGKLTVLREPHLDADRRFGRVNRSWRWVSPPSNHPVVVHPDLLSMLRSEEYAPPNPKRESVAKDAHDLTILLTKALVDHTDDIHRLRAEMLRSFEAHLRFGAPPSDGLVEWIDELSALNHRMTATLKGDDMSSWPDGAPALAAFSRSLDLIRTSRFSEVNWDADRNA
jgi:hypothetical protein